MRTLKLDHNFLFTWLAPVAVAGLLSACGGGDGGAAGGGAAGGGDAPGGGAGTTPPAATDAPAGGGAPADSPAAGGGDAGGAAGGEGGAAGGAAAGGGGGGSQQLIALGDSVFHGQAGGGTCYACHGQDGTGSGVGPNLTDNEWLNTDGTLEGITKVVQNGVPQPKQAPAPMPPMGGASLNPEQVKAVATYVHSLGGGK
ncbi:MAG TPA: c-type cytochrome [Gemmatimonadales bacterium]|nr:c-type cytochrome [Gemmatimonadales bacterium]